MTIRSLDAAVPTRGDRARQEGHAQALDKLSVTGEDDHGLRCRHRDQRVEGNRTPCRSAGFADPLPVRVGGRRRSSSPNVRRHESERGLRPGVSPYQSTTQSVTMFVRSRPRRSLWFSSSPVIRQHCHECRHQQANATMPDPCRRRPPTPALPQVCLGFLSLRHRRQLAHPKTGRERPGG